MSLDRGPIDFYIESGVYRRGDPLPDVDFTGVQPDPRMLGIATSPETLKRAIDRMLEAHPDSLEIKFFYLARRLDS